MSKSTTAPTDPSDDVEELVERFRTHRGTLEKMTQWDSPISERAEKALAILDHSEEETES